MRTVIFQNLGCEYDEYRYKEDIILFVHCKISDSSPIEYSIKPRTDRVKVATSGQKFLSLLENNSGNI